MWDIFEKTQEKLFLFQRFVTSIVDALVQSHRRLVEAKDI